jgi:hypothetical protein
MSAHDLFVGGGVDAVGLHGALFVHDDVAVLPRDLRELVHDDLFGPATGHGHLVDADVEEALDEVPGHPGSLSAGRWCCPGGGF